jgi:hypothetical protein
VPSHEDVWGYRVIAPPFLTSAPDGGEWSASSSDRFTPRKSIRYPLYRRLIGLQSRSGCCGEANNLLPLTGIESRPSIPYPTAILTKLSRLNSFTYSIFKQLMKELCIFFLSLIPILYSYFLSMSFCRTDSDRSKIFMWA